MSAITSIETITNALRDEPKIRAVYLSGSYGAGLEDIYSDVDFLVVTTDGPSDEFASLWHRAVSRTGEIVLWWDRQVKPMLINAITDQWLRVDVEAATPDQMVGRNKKGLKVLFDRDGIFDTLSDTSRPSGHNPARLKWQIEEFIRIVGLLPLALGRQEYLNSVTGAFYLRNMLVELFIEETATPNRGGALHLNRLITQEQKAVLTSLPALEPTPEAIRDAVIAYAAAYLPRARTMAKKVGVEWPERFEAATWDHLKTALQIQRPYESEG